MYQCVNCRRQTSVTAGTVFDKTRIPLVKWFLALYLVGTDKRGCSAKTLERELGISYQSAWFLLHKIRKAMMEREWHHMLSGIVEVDDVFYGAPDEGGKRGRGAEKTKFIVGLSLSREGKPKFLKMEAFDEINANNLTQFIHENLESGSTITTDAFATYKSVAGEGFNHNPKAINPKTDMDHLKWLHTVVSNFKAFVQGTYHGLDGNYFDLYLAEFCYRFNRRYRVRNMVERLSMACVSGSPFRYAELTR